MARVELEGHEGHRFHLTVEGDPGSQPAALVFPGLRYSPARPLLHYTHKLLRNRGWAVVEAWYDYDRPEFLTAHESQRHSWITADAVTAWKWARSHGKPGLLVGKSIGTLAMALLRKLEAESSVAGVWLTPLLRADDVLQAILEDHAPGLLAAGEADPATPPELLERLQRPGLHTLVLPGAGHSLEAGEVLPSLELLRDYLQSLDAFLGVL